MEEGRLPTKIALILTLAAALVIGLFIFFDYSGQKEIPRITNYDLNNTASTYASPTVLAADPSLGPPNAAYTIVEFGDYECPACASTATELATLLKQRTDTRLVWKDYPLSGHENAEAAAEAARCAGDQGQYWPYHDLLFANQNSLGGDLYAAAAESLKLDAGAFSACIASGRHAADTVAGTNAGVAAGIDSIPFLFINGHAYGGNDTAAEINAAINSLK